VTPREIDIQPAGAAFLDVMAALHGAAFGPAAWRAPALGSCLALPGAFALLAILGGDAAPAGFILCSLAGGDGEILTLAVDPARQRRGAARRLVRAALARAQAAGAAHMVLEVARDNIAARRLYEGCGFKVAGRRKNYYRRPDGRMDALILRRPLDDHGAGAAAV
jgi:ribosomal-protein-alanine N-acetyltransferase